MHSPSLPPSALQVSEHNPGGGEGGDGGDGGVDGGGAIGGVGGGEGGRMKAVVCAMGRKTMLLSQFVLSGPSQRGSASATAKDAGSPAWCRAVVIAAA